MSRTFVATHELPRRVERGVGLGEAAPKEEGLVAAGGEVVAKAADRAVGHPGIHVQLGGERRGTGPHVVVADAVARLKAGPAGVGEVVVVVLQRAEGALGIILVDEPA